MNQFTKQHIVCYIDNIVEAYPDMDKQILMNIFENTKTNSCEMNSSLCPYIFIKGVKKGQVCRASTFEGLSYCSLHKNHEGKETKERKVIPSKKSIKPVTKKTPPIKKMPPTLRKNKDIDQLWHPETGMVFKSATERIVIGKMEKNKMVSLTDEDIEICKQNCFKFKQPESVVETKLDENSNEHDDIAMFYLVSDKKFWEGTVSGTTLKARYGKLGTEGKNVSKEFDDFEQAMKELEKMVNEKKKKGYVLDFEQAMKELEKSVNQKKNCVFEENDDVNEDTTKKALGIENDSE